GPLVDNPGRIGLVHVPVDLLSGAGRRGDPGEITLFKSVGYALEDLVAARRVVDNAA
ncbi:ornithine cyclodeaminase family protein, partial [Pseudomonas aeruginosa]